MTIPWAAAWVVEKLQNWSDSTTDLDKTFTKDQALTNIMIYLVTDTMGTGVWYYRSPVEEGQAPPRGKIMVHRIRGLSRGEGLSPASKERA
jgi:hypothetical protein